MRFVKWLLQDWNFPLGLINYHPSIMYECLYLSNIYEDGALLLFTLKQSVTLY